MNKKITVFIISAILFTGIGLFSSAVSAATTIDTVTVCIKNSGFVYVIGQGFWAKDCGKRDKLLTINSAGVPGPKGDIGAQGPKGDIGEVGAIGPQGPIGLTGSQGLKGDDGTTGATGEIGPKGETGVNGTNGTNGVSGWERVSGAIINNHDNSKTATATCPAGKVVVGGGFLETNNLLFAVTANYPSSDTVWTVTGNSLNPDFTLQSYAICVTAN